MRTILLAIFLFITAPFAQALDVTMGATILGDDHPYVLGSTNLPAGTKLLIQLRLKDNGGEYRAFSDAFVGDTGKFRSERFANSRFGLKPATYTISVTLGHLSFQPSAVREVLGQSGNHMRGPLIVGQPFRTELRYMTDVKVAKSASAIQAEKDGPTRPQSLLKSCTASCDAARTIALAKGDGFGYAQCTRKCSAQIPPKP
jgi:hypothetical protein